MLRKYYPEQKVSALIMLQNCSWTKYNYKGVEKSLYEKYKRILDNELTIVFKDYEEFIIFYVKQINKQNGKCFYCGLVGDVKIHYKNQLEILQMEYFRKGKRGKSLELERKVPNAPYNDDCALACYPCNNAKSDVFIGEEFEIIGAVIGALKKDGLEKLKNADFIKNLITDVTKATNGKI